MKLTNGGPSWSKFLVFLFLWIMVVGSALIGIPQHNGWFVFTLWIVSALSSTAAVYLDEMGWEP